MSLHNYRRVVMDVSVFDKLYGMNGVQMSNFHVVKEHGSLEGCV